MTGSDHDKPVQTGEGVIQFALQWQRTETIAADLAALNAWRDILWKLELIGEDPARYDGYGFGNVSIRHGQGGQAGNRFIISGTQTGQLEHIRDKDYALVTDIDVAGNRVVAEGPVKPSSEAMTHGVIYARDASIGCVLHVHSPDIWQASQALALPETREDVPYGTPRMAAEVERLFTEIDVRDRGLFTMRGHLDGVVAFGATPEAAGKILVTALAHSKQ